MSIKCGRCRDYHPTVADVRACFNGQQAETQTYPKTGQPISEKQVKYIGSLLSKLNAVYTGKTPVEELDKFSEGRKLLDGLVGARENQAYGRAYQLPENVSQSAKPVENGGERTAGGKFNPGIPKGYYATPSTTGHNDLDFWFVNVVEREGSQWDGWRTVSRVIGGRASTRVNRAVRRSALKAIISYGVDKAGDQFADNLGRCKKCGKHLTDETSRDRRMGPDCYARMAGS